MWGKLEARWVGDLIKLKLQLVTIVIGAISLINSKNCCMKLVSKVAIL